VAKDLAAINLNKKVQMLLKSEGFPDGSVRTRIGFIVQFFLERWTDPAKTILVIRLMYKDFESVVAH
jgi:hypothetical protein